MIMKNQPYYNPTTTLLPDKKLASVFIKLDLLQTNAIVPITDVENIPYIKQYIDCFKNVEFNSDYSSIRKLNIFWCQKYVCRRRLWQKHSKTRTHSFIFANIYRVQNHTFSTAESLGNPFLPELST